MHTQKSSEAEHTESFRLGDKEITLLKLKSSSRSHYVIFPFTDTGLHISYHPNNYPILQEEKTGRNLAKLDIEAIGKLDERDLRSLFAYPKHRGDVFVIPIGSLLIFEQMAARPFDIPYPLELLFSKRLMYKIRAKTLREFLALNRGNHVIIDPVQEALLIFGDGFERLGPMRLGLRHPLGSKGLRKLFSIQYALMAYLESNDAHVRIPEPNDTMVSEWKARLEMLFSEVSIRRWGRGGRIRELGSLGDRKSTSSPKMLSAN